MYLQPFKWNQRGSIHNDDAWQKLWLWLHINVIYSLNCGSLEIFWVRDERSSSSILRKRFLSRSRGSNPQPSDDRWDALTIELPTLIWWAKVQVWHMCDLSGSHYMLMMWSMRYIFWIVGAWRYFEWETNVRQALSSENYFWAPLFSQGWPCKNCSFVYWILLAVLLLVSRKWSGRFFVNYIVRYITVVMSIHFYQIPLASRLSNSWLRDWSQRKLNNSLADW